MTDVPAPSEVEVDVVVLGLGPGGEHVAIKLARAGLDVIGVEDRLVGGECPYYGCVPSKMMIAAAHVVAAARKVPDFGGTATVEPDWSEVARRVRDEATDDWDDAVAVKRLEDSGARFHRGRGVLDGPGRVRVDGTTYVARKGVVLNTGTRPAAPPIDGLEGTPYWTNRDAVTVTDLPASLVVLGGGPIGCEFAQIFARYGVDVTVVEVADRLVAVEEPEASEVLTKAFTDEGITVLAGATVDSVTHDDDGFTLRVDGKPVRAEKLLVAAGRHANLDFIGLDTVGLPDDLKVVETDERMRAGELLVGDRRHHGQGRLHARVDVPGGGRGPRRARRGRSLGRLPRGPAGHVHRARGGLGGPEREGRARRGPRRGGLDRRPRCPRLAGQGAGRHQAGRRPQARRPRRRLRRGRVGRRDPVDARGGRARGDPGGHAAHACTSPTRPTTGPSSTR